MSAVRDTSASHILAGASVRDPGNVLRTIVGIEARDGAGLHSVLSGSAAHLSYSPHYANGSGYSKATINVTTNVVTVSAPTGSTFVWSFADAGFSASAATSASTAFSARVASGQDVQTTAICTVTTNGSTAMINVRVDISNNYGGQS